MWKAGVSSSACPPIWSGVEPGVSGPGGTGDLDDAAEYRSLRLYVVCSFLSAPFVGGYDRESWPASVYADAGTMHGD